MGARRSACNTSCSTFHGASGARHGSSGEAGRCPTPASSKSPVPPLGMAANLSYCVHLPPFPQHPVAGRGGSQQGLPRAVSLDQTLCRDLYGPGSTSRGAREAQERWLSEQRCPRVPQPRKRSDRPAAAVPFPGMTRLLHSAPRAPSRGHSVRFREVRVGMWARHFQEAPLSTSTAQAKSQGPSRVTW